ncbi:hypothetical protein M422DRAFT_238836 [Sphaerobolus stellatus SS14]|nr:hypothetical protein M422DRAFT_238836 [Sphaerobolus stellatus SS14]
MSLRSPLPPDMEALKAQGNYLFIRGQYLEAIERFTAAIEIIGDNAILFANRAACFLPLRNMPTRSIPHILGQCWTPAMPRDEAELECPMGQFTFASFNQLLDAKSGSEQKFNLEQLEKLNAIANELIDDLERVGQAIDDRRPGHMSSFYTRPKAMTHAMLGYVHVRKPRLITPDNETEEREAMLQAAKAYIQAADLYPEDDENHCPNLCEALKYSSQVGSAAAEKLTLMERIRLSYDNMQKS